MFTDNNILKKCAEVQNSAYKYIWHIADRLDKKPYFAYDVSYYTQSSNPNFYIRHTETIKKHATMRDGKIIDSFFDDLKTISCIPYFCGFVEYDE